MKRHSISISAEGTGGALFRVAIRHPLMTSLRLMYALLAGVAGGYQHVPFVLHAPLPRPSSSPPFSLSQASPSRSSGAFMWTPSWRAPVTVDTSAPRRERRRHIFMWLFTSIRNVAGLPVRVSVAAGRAMRSMCLYLRRPWSARYDTDTRSLPGARGSKASLAPSPAQRRAREARIKTLVRLDSEGVFSSLTKCACPRHAATYSHPGLPVPTLSPTPAPPCPPCPSPRRWHTLTPALPRISQAAARPDKASR